MEQMHELTEPVRIREEDVALQLGVSRTPVREALIRLDGKGIVSLRPGKGALLSPVTDEEYIEWLHLREYLEGYAAREAAQNASYRDVIRLRAIFEPFINGIDGESTQNAYAQANVNFHNEIIKLAGSSLLEKVWEAFGHRQLTYKRQSIKRFKRSNNSLREHLDIIEAIEDRDADKAEALAKNHVRAVLISFNKYKSDIHSQK